MVSIKSLTSRDTVTIQRVASAQSAAGTRTETWNTGNRGTLPTTWKCRAQPLSGEERVQYGVEDKIDVWKFLGESNPQVDTRDRFTWTDNDGVAQTADVTHPSRNLDGQGRLYRVLGESIGNES